MTRLHSLKGTYRQLRSNLRDFRLKVMLAISLREFFRDRINVERAQEEIKRALDNREDRFLELVRTQVYGRPSGPYLRLLRLAGCEFSDLQTYVHRHGVDGTLEKLASEGFYRTADEFKGKKEVVRGGQSFDYSDAQIPPAAEYLYRDLEYSLDVCVS